MKKGAMRARRLAAVVAATGVLLATLGVLNASGQVLPSGTVGDFEDDGNMTAENAVPGPDVVPGFYDWNTAPGERTTGSDDSDDTGYAGSSKENEPENFVCNEGGGSPGKNNILRAYVNTRITGPANQNPTRAFLDLAFVRDAGTGDAHINFEFNRNSITNPCPYTGRTTGDLLLTFDYPGGTGAAGVSAFSWNAALDGGLGNWVPLTLPVGSAAGATNLIPITDTIANTLVPARQFGEATVDLVAFQTVTPSPLLTCPGLGYVNIRSRSSGESFNAALQDRLPQAQVNISSCGSVKLKKTDDKNQPLAGANFGLFTTVDADGNATGNPAYTCTSVVTTGFCTFPIVTPGNYFAKEIAPAPTGYALDPDTVPVTVAFRENVDLTSTPFVDPRDTGFVKVTKVLKDAAGAGGQVVTPSPDLNVLNGTSFRLYQDANLNDAFDAGELSKLWPSNADATCTISGGTGNCTIGPVPTGNYRVSEITGPPNSVSAGDVNVVVTKGTAPQAVNVNYINILNAINITLDKSAGATANVGDTVQYGFNAITTGPRLHSITLVELVNVCAAAPVFQANSDTNANGFLESLETWHWSCSHIITMADSDPLDNSARVTGTDDYGRTATSTDTASVDILYPDVTVSKVPVTTPISAGAPASFTITASVGGDDGSVARSVTVNDTLPSGFAWSENSASCSISGGVTLLCSFGDLAKGQTRSVTVTTATTTEDCGNIANTATVSATNEPQAAQSNNSSNATIHVTCGDVAILKTADNSPISAGDTAAFTIQVTTDAISAVNDVTVSDTLPTGIVWVEDSAECSINGLLLSCDFGNLPVNSIRTVHVSGLTDAADCRILSNTATVAASNEPPGETANNTSTATLTVDCPDVKIEKTSVSPISAGDTAAFTIVVTNLGPGTARAVGVSDPLPPGVDWVEDSDSCTIATGTLTCSFGDMAPLATRTVHVTGATDVADCGTLSNTGTASATNEPAGKLANNTSTATITVNCPDVKVEKTADDDEVDAGDTAAFTIVVSSLGPGTAKGVGLSDPLPPGVDWAEDSDSCTIALGTLDCAFGDLAPAATRTVHVTGAVDNGDCGELSNTATVTATNEAESKLANNTSTADITVLCAIAIGATKDGDQLAHVGDTVDYVIGVTNTGDADLVAVLVTDPVCAADTLALVDDADGDAILAIGETWTYTCSHVVTASDPDPLPNTVQVLGTDVHGRTTPASANHSVDILHPGIKIDKTANPTSVEPGQSVTYTYVVTNTGDALLSNVTVTDDKLGTIGTIAELAAGASATLTKTVVIAGDSPTTNVGTATGTDELGQTVTATDDAKIDIVLPLVILELPRTGFALDKWVWIGLLLVLLGCVLQLTPIPAADTASSRRR